MAEFRKNTGYKTKRRRQLKQVITLQRAITKKVANLWRKNRRHHQLPPRVTPTLVTPLGIVSGLPDYTKYITGSQGCKNTFLLCSNTKYKILFFPNVFQIQNTCGLATAFLSTMENVITVVVHNVKHSSEHTTQSLQFCSKPVNHIRHSGREAARLAVTAYKLILLH